MVVTRWVYRAAQFRRALVEERHSVRGGSVSAYLSPRGQALFGEMSRRDQAHCVRTAELLIDAGHTDSALIVAALLHDAGKGPQAVWQRALFVILSAVSPALVAGLARAGAETRGALFRSLNHASLGAMHAAEAGCSNEVCTLIAQHHQQAAGPQVKVLQWADEVA